MEQHWLDDVSKTLARGISRKAFLGLLGSAALAAVTSVPAPVAVAQQRRCQDGCINPGSPDCCGEFCTSLDSDASNCGTCGRRCGNGEVCFQGECTTPDLPVRCEPPCGPNQLCVSNADGTRCCDRALFCGGACLDTPPQQCQGEDGEGQEWCCPSDHACCGNGACCPPGVTCCGGGCCDPGSVCLGDPNDPGAGLCCPSSHVCVNECCSEETECLNGTCWPKCTTPCAGGEICLDRGDPEAGIAQTCCPAALVWDVGVSTSTSRGLCCPPQNRWVRSEGFNSVADCCPPEHQWEEGKLCCPAERRCGVNNNVCCPDGQTCNADRRCEGCPELNLSGVWDDNGRQVRIVHGGNTVAATYLEPYVCDHRDGTGATSQTTIDFIGTLDCLTLTGETSTCRYGRDNDAGIEMAPMVLTVSEDGNSMDGRWEGTDGSGGISLTRVSPEPAVG